MKPEHIAQVSYFAHFCKGFIFCTFFETKYFLARAFSRIRGCKLYKILINSTGRKEEKKKIDGCLNEEHVEYATWILLSSRRPFVEGSR